MGPAGIENTRWQGRICYADAPRSTDHLFSTGLGLAGPRLLSAGEAGRWARVPPSELRASWARGSGPGNSLFQLRGQVVQYSFDQTITFCSFLFTVFSAYVQKKKVTCHGGMVPVPSALTPGMGCRKKALFLLPRAVTYCRIFKCTANHCWSFMRILALRKKKEKEDGACWQNE